jgi:ketosteroid isomerase-like protein
MDENLEIDWSNSIGPLKASTAAARAQWSCGNPFLEAWQEVRWDPQEFIEVDENRVIVVYHLRMRGSRSGIDIDATSAQLWTIKDGKGRRIKLYQSKSDALEGARLSE